MNKIKDFFYDKNDIVFALLILAAAALVILWRVDVIVDYPQELVAKTYVVEKPSVPITTPYEHNAGTSEPDDQSGEAGTSSEGEKSTDTGISGIVDDVPEMFAVYINYGETTAQVAETIVALGFFETTEEFLQLVNTMGADTKIQTGNHVIPENATKEEVIQYLMEPGL